MCEKIKQIPMSASTATIKSEVLADDVLAQLDAAFRVHHAYRWPLMSPQMLLIIKGSAASALASGSC